MFANKKIWIVISNQEFYSKLTQEGTLPTTSQPSIGDFVQVYEEAASDSVPILSIHISSKLSATVSSASLATDRLPQAQIEVIDSLSTSMGLGLIVLAAARATHDRQPLPHIRADIEALARDVNVFFVVDTGGGNFLYNQEPLTMTADITCVPPRAVFEFAPGCLELYTLPVGGAHVANLITVRHFVNEERVPSMTGWFVVALILLLLAGGFFVIRRQRRLAVA